MEPRGVAEQAGSLQVLDVREPEEWRAGRIEGALHIPLGDLETNHEGLDPSRRVVVVCRSGDRAGRAAEMLRSEGFTAAPMAGGLERWVSDGLPLVDAEGRPGRVAERPAADPGMERTKEMFLDVLLAYGERFADREPTDEEAREFVREWMRAAGLPPEETNEEQA